MHIMDFGFPIFNSSTIKILNTEFIAILVHLFFPSETQKSVIIIVVLISLNYQYILLSKPFWSLELYEFLMNLNLKFGLRKIYM